MNRFLDRLELRTNRAFWSDGLLDLLAGAAVLIIGISWVAGAAAYGGIAPALLVPLWRPLRRRFTDPRLGQVELGEGRQSRNRRFMRLMLVAGAMSFLLGLGAFLVHELGLPLHREIIPALPGALVGLAGVATAEALQLRRFAIYGGISIVTAIAVAVAQGPNPGWAFVAAGAAMLLGGTVLAARFAAHHRPVEDAG